MLPEQKARLKIDELLLQSDWAIQDFKQVNLGAKLGIAVREFPLEEGFADYLLFVNKKPIGVIEAKAEGTTLSGVAEQSEKYRTGKLRYIANQKEPLRFAYESTGVETFFRDASDPDPRSRRVFTFHTPETLLEYFSSPVTLRKRLTELPPLLSNGLRNCQTEAITNLENSFAKDQPRALIQMATGSGKTFTAVSFAYRLIKFAKAKRILFLVDRNNLGRQTKNEFYQYITPDDGRKFSELYNVQHLQSNTFDPVSKVCIATIQRVFSTIKGEELDPSLEELSNFDSYADSQKAKVVTYNPKIPIDTFDFIVTDECHRSIYNIWRQVLEYFDAHLIGLTATPSKQTIGFFNQNLVMEYDHTRAVADGVNVGFDIYEIETKITKQGSVVESGFYIDKRNKETREVRWQKLDQDFEYKPNQLDRDVVAKDQIRTVIKTFKEKLFTEIFPSRSEVPKTLIFAKDDSHAEDIVQLTKEVFGKGNDFVKKITYRTSGEKPEDILASFRNSFNPRIAVTVDMIATGTDIRPLECILFMRDIRSRIYFEQMVGRGTRTISSTDLISVTPDAHNKTHFIAVDAVGVFKSIKLDSKPTERKPTVPFDKLLISIALGNHDEDTIETLAGRLARLDRETDSIGRKEIESASNGVTLKNIVNRLFDAVDPDKQIEKAKELFSKEAPTQEEIESAKQELVKQACLPFDNETLRNTLIDIKKKNEQSIPPATYYF
jgi:type I restriction enzyme R subunit